MKIREIISILSKMPPDDEWQVTLPVPFKEFVSLLAKEMAELTNTSPSPTPDVKPMSIEQAAEYLSISVQTLRGLVRTKAIPFSKPSKRIYFYKSELDKWVNAKN